MKALVVSAVGACFNLEDVQIAAPIGREVRVEVRASGTVSYRPTVRHARPRLEGGVSRNARLEC